MWSIIFLAGDDVRKQLLPSNDDYYADGSNIGIPGVYAYRIDEENILEPGTEDLTTCIVRNGKLSIVTPSLMFYTTVEK